MASQPKVNSEAELGVWGGHFYVGTSTKRVEKGDMEGAFVDNIVEPAFFADSHCFAKTCRTMFSMIAAFQGGKMLVFVQGFVPVPT